MQIIEYNYRKPNYLKSLEISVENIDTIGIHHTGNNNSLKTNTDYHIETKKWAWCGYGFYITEGKIYRIRGMKYQDAGIRGHNWHTVNIAVQGNYDIDKLSAEDMKALEWLIRYLKEKNPNIKYIKGHNEFNDTSCPGRNFDVKLIIANTKQEPVDNSDKLKMKELQRDNEFLIKNNIDLIAEIERVDGIIKKEKEENERLERIIKKDREKYDELKEIYKNNLKLLKLK